MGKTINKQLKEIANHYGSKERLKALSDACFDLTYACRAADHAYFGPLESDGSDNYTPAPLSETLKYFMEKAVAVDMLISQVMYLLDVDMAALGSLKAYSLFIETKQIEEQE